MIDAALQGAVGDALLLLNEVLQKGFDAGHFITGLAQHLRDVLVSKDAATAPLLETSDAIRQHYQQQATRCNARWIFNALDIMNTCDIHFRTAKNKRLTVELALVKLCRLVEVPEVQTVVTPVKPVAQSTPQPATKPAPQVAPKSEPQPQVSQPQVPKAKPASLPISMPSIPSISIKQSSSPSAQPVVNETTSQAKEQRNTPFTVDQLIDAWAGLSNYFPGEERLNAMLTTLVPELVSPEMCRITVANPWQKQEFGKFGKRVMDIVRDRLKNDNLRLQVEVGDYTKTTRAYTSSEKYKVLVEMNPHVAELKSRLNLQLE
jgi:DNA polymerase-3 subunit gamma/tau